MELIPLISICIPTYNRCEKVYKLVNDILLYEGEDIEVVVLDNCSTDNTKSLLNKITDKRFSFFQNQENIGGIFNPLKAISLGSGKFAVLCLDKDYLDFRSIKKIIENITIDSEIVFGRCDLNIQNENLSSSSIIYKKGYDSIINMAYLSSHPSGMFYKTAEYRNLELVKNIFVEQKPFSFYPDLINAEMAMIGKSQLLKLPSFFTESKDEASKSPSFTYDINNVYFSPAKRILEFDAYLESVEKLRISSYELAKIIFKIYGRGLMFSTFIYKIMLNDDDVCIHNKIAKRKVKLFELWKLNLQFSMHFFKKKIKLNFLQKGVIVLCWNVKFFVKSIFTLI